MKLKSNEIKSFTKEFKTELKNHNYIVIFHHIRPDGDCLGSQHGLKTWIQKKYPDKHVYAIGDNEGLFEYLNFEFDQIPQDDILNQALGIVVDANYSNRIKENEIILAKKLKTMIRIDHHPENDDIDFKLRFVDPTYCSSAEQIAHLIYLIDKKSLDQKCATYLYLGIYTDSGRFFYDYVSPRTHLLTAWLMESQFNVFDLHKKLSKRTISELEFNKVVLNGYKTYKNVIYYFCSIDEIKKLKIDEIASNRVDFLANIEGYDIWIFFIENKDKSIRVRLRSSQKDISQLARRYNGGGHKKASGAIIYNKEDIEKIVKEASELKN